MKVWKKNINIIFYSDRVTGVTTQFGANSVNISHLFGAVWVGSGSGLK